MLTPFYQVEGISETVAALKVINYGVYYDYID